MRSLSVVIPYFNGARFIDRAVDSVIKEYINSHYSKLKIIIIDDASQESLNINKQQKDGIEIVCIQNKENKGTLISRMIGLDAIDSDSDLHLLDQDDYILPGFYRMGNMDCSVCVSNYYIEYEDNRTIRFQGDPRRINKRINRRQVYLQTANPFHSPGAMLFRGDAVLAVKEYFGIFSEVKGISGADDSYLLLNLVDRHFHIEFNSEPVFVYTVHDTNQSKNIGWGFLGKLFAVASLCRGKGIISESDFREVEAFLEFRSAVNTNNLKKLLFNCIPCLRYYLNRIR